jgi:hypothetical protein
MQRIHKKVSIGVFAVAACALLLLSASKASVPNDSSEVDPIVGVWNMTLSSGGTTELVTRTFNQGGTTVEYDTAGINSFTSPGESLVQGVWKKTGSNTYMFKEQNFIFGDASGNLSADNITTCQVTFGRDGNSFTATCDFAFYQCSLALCPGAFIASGPGTMTATRFQ